MIFVVSLLAAVAPLDGLAAALEARAVLVISINPESRVKVARGPADAVLLRDTPTPVVVKIVNDAGIKHALRVEAVESGQDRPLFAAAFDPPAPQLSGRPVEYAVLRVTCREAGKRELTLRFDAGQGTQDLGFRSEIPVLFDVRNKP